MREDIRKYFTDQVGPERISGYEVIRKINSIESNRENSKEALIEDLINLGCGIVTNDGVEYCIRRDSGVVIGKGD